MRLYLSSFRLGRRPEALLRLLGDRVRTAVVANADDYKPPADRRDSLRHELDELLQLGLAPTELDLRTYFGNPSDLRAKLSEADCVWVRGGNTFVLRRALAQSGADAVINDLLARDAIVYAGYSAGVAVLAPSLRGLDLIDDPVIVPPGYDNGIIWDGLAVLSYPVLSHYRSDHPESAAVDRSVAYFIDNHVPFLALRDGQVIVRDSDGDSVIE